MKNTYQLLTEKYVKLSESLEPEQRTFNDPDNGLEIEIDGDDDNSGTLHYMGYEFPISKQAKGTHVVYFVGSLVNGKEFKVADYTQFTKVLAALERGEVKPTTSTSSMFSKVQRAQPGEMVTVYYPNRRIPGEYIEKQRIYMTNNQAEKYIYDMYMKHGNKIFLSGEEGKESNPLYGYATDNANYSNDYSKYWDLTRWASKMNLAAHRGGFKGSNIIGGRSRE